MKMLVPGCPVAICCRRLKAKAALADASSCWFVVAAARPSQLRNQSRVATRAPRKFAAEIFLLFMVPPSVPGNTCDYLTFSRLISGYDEGSGVVRQAINVMRGVVCARAGKGSQSKVVAGGWRRMHTHQRVIPAWAAGLTINGVLARAEAITSRPSRIGSRVFFITHSLVIEHWG